MNPKNPIEEIIEEYRSKFQGFVSNDIFEEWLRTTLTSLIEEVKEEWFKKGYEDAEVETKCEIIEWARKMKIPQEFPNIGRAKNYNQALSDLITHLQEPKEK